MRAVVVIPARFASTRFPGKPLAPLAGKPLIRHVYENSMGARRAGRVIVATDSPEIRDAVLSFGGEAVMTSPAHPSGTDRIAEAAARIECDIIVNVQGDEPLVRPEAIDRVIELLDDARAHIGTLVRRIRTRDDALDPNIVKAAIGRDGFALYFSRLPVPYHRDLWRGLEGIDASGAALFHHMGIYSYRRETLLELAGLPPTALEVTERLEQLRALEHGMRIKTAEVEYEFIGVDTPRDLERVEKWLNSSS